MRLTKELLAATAGGKTDESNMNSIVVAVNGTMAVSGLDKPHRLVQFVAQVAHESGRFRYDREVWGPTPAQKRYEGRKDLGNVQPGDGGLFRGHGPIQVTGRANTEEFEAWCHTLGLAAPVPDFTTTPSLINTDPWEGLSAVWYWTTRRINEYADKGDVEMVTRRINGGSNGLADRLELYVRCALLVLGYELGKGVVARFQSDVRIKADDIPGPATRKALHERLVALGGKDASQVVDKTAKRDAILAEIRQSAEAPMPSIPPAAVPVPIVPAPVADTHPRRTFGDVLVAIVKALFKTRSA